MQRSVEWYLARGFDRKVAEYYVAGRRKIVSVKANDDFTLTLGFDNGELRLLDCKPFLKPNTVFEPFMTTDNFRRVYLDEFKSVCWDIDPSVDSNEVWSNKVDLCPDSCYLDSAPVDRAAWNPDHQTDSR